MKNLKKVLALVMAFTIAFTVMAGAAFTDAADIQQVEAVNMLTALNVIEGEPDGSFNPSGTVTRAQMAKMIYVVMSGGETNADTYSTMNTTFTDINGHWAAGFIKFCQTNGIIAGKSATQFDPDAEVTGTEAAKMLLVVMGYEPARAKLTGTGWDNNTIALATQAGLLKNVNATLTEGLPRQYAAQIIYNTLDAWRVKWSNDSGTFDYFADTGAGNKETVGFKYMKLTKDIGTMTNISADTLTINVSSTDEPDSVHGAGDTTFTKVKEDYTTLLGERVKVLTRDRKTNEVLGVYAMEDNVSYNVNAADVEDDDAKIKFGGKSYTLKLVGGANNQIRVLKTNLNGSLSDSNQTSSYFSDLAQSSNTFKFVDTDGDGKLDTAIETAYTAAEVTYASSSQIIAGATYKYDDEHISEDIAKDDWAVISYNRYLDCKEIAKADITKAKLTGMKKDTRADRTQFDVYQIDSTWYNASNNTEANGTGNENLKSVKAGDNVEAAVVNGVVYYIKRTSDSANSISDVAMVLNVADPTAIGGRQVKVLFFDGTTKIVDFDSDAKSGTVAYGSLAVGSVYEYAVSSDKYSFSNPRNGSASGSQYADYYGDFTYLGEKTYTATEDNIGGDKIADSAKVLLYSTADRDYKTLTGKQLKNLTARQLGATVQTQVFKGDMDGLKQLGAIGVITNEELPDNIQTKDNYAYLLSDAYYTSGTNSMTYTIWTGSEEVTVRESGSRLNDRKKGTVVGYASLKGDEDVKTIEDVTKIDMTPNAITSVNSKQTTFTLETPITGGSQFDVGSNSTVLYVNSDTSEGVETGTIREASKKNNKNIQNVLAYGDVSSDIEVLIVDIQNEIVKNPYMAATSAWIDTSKLAAGVTLKNSAGTALTNNSTVKTGDELTLEITLSNASTITLTGAKFSDGKDTKSFGAGAVNEKITVDGTADTIEVAVAKTGITLAAVPNSVTTAATVDILGSTTDKTTGAYASVWNKYANTNNQSVAVGEEIKVNITNNTSTHAPSGTTEKIGVYVDGKLVSDEASFKGAASVASTTTVTLTVTVTADMDGKALEIKATQDVAPEAKIIKVELQDEFGVAYTGSDVTDVKKLVVTFDQDMEASTIVAGNWSYGSTTSPASAELSADKRTVTLVVGTTAWATTNTITLANGATTAGAAVDSGFDAITLTDGTAGAAVQVVIG